LIFTVLLALGYVAGAQTQMVRLTRYEGRNITGVNVSNSFRVAIYPSENTSAQVVIPAAYEEFLIFEIDSRGVVKIGLRSGYDRVDRGRNNRNTPQLRATVYLPTLETLNISGASKVIAQSKEFHSDNTSIKIGGTSHLWDLTLVSAGCVTMDCSGASGFRGILNAREIRSELSGTSDVTLTVCADKGTFKLSGASGLRIKQSGNIGDLSVECTGASHFRGQPLAANSANLKSSGASSVETGNISGSLDAEASGASSIRYSGSPAHLNVRSSSASSIRKR